jgi:hypothetical protein
MFEMIMFRSFQVQNADLTLKMEAQNMEPPLHFCAVNVSIAKTEPVMNYLFNMRDEKQTPWPLVRK